MVITSASNPRIVLLRSLHTTHGRKKHNLFLMEGPHLVTAALDAHQNPSEVYYQPALLQRTVSGQQLLARLLQVAAVSLIEVSERVIEALGDTQASQGIVAVFPLHIFQAEAIQARRRPAHRPCLLLLDAISDPGNMGTILRTALAADVAEVLLTPDCVDVYSPKVVRSAAGAHLLLPVWDHLSWSAISERMMAHCVDNLRVLLATAEASAIYYDVDLVRPWVLIIGNEAHGPSAQARALATQAISIPLANAVESLNAAIATSIILYESVRQSRIAGL